LLYFFAQLLPPPLSDLSELMIPKPYEFEIHKNWFSPRTDRYAREIFGHYLPQYATIRNGQKRKKMVRTDLVRRGRQSNSEQSSIHASLIVIRPMNISPKSTR